MLLLLAAAVWGMGFVAQETAMEHIGPMAFVGLRYLLAGLAVLPFALNEQHARRETARRQQQHHAPFTLRNLLPVIPIGIAFFLANATQQVGLLATTVTNAGFLTALYVVFVPLITLVILRKRQAAIIWPASGLALGGIFLLSGGSLSVLNWGDWLTIVSAVFWSLHVILVGRIAGQYGMPYTLAAAQFLIAGLIGMIAHWFIPLPGINEPALTIQALTASAPQILYSGLIAGGFAFTLQVIAQQKTSAAATAILLSSESLFAAALAALLLGERLSSIGYLGGLMIFAAILLIGLWPPPKGSVPTTAHEPLKS